MTAPYQPMKPSILDRLANRLFPNFQGFAPEIEQGLGRQGLLQIGTNLLQAGGPQAQQGGTLANLGASIGGVDVNALTRQALAMQAYRQQQASQQRVQEVAAQTRSIKDPYQRVAAMVAELAGEPGTEDLVGKLSNVLAQLKPSEPRAVRQVVRAGINPQTQKPELFRINLDTGETTPLGLGAVQQPAIPTESERRAGALHMVAEQAFELLQSATAPTLEQAAVEQLPFGVGNTVLSAQRQQQRQAALQLAQSYNYVVSGAASTEAETERAAQTFLPQLGDKPATLKQKAAARARAIAAIRLAAGRAAPAPVIPAAPEEPDDENFDDFLTPP